MRAAPCCRRQSVNPPVDEPTSRQTGPWGSMLKSASAPSSLIPPRLAYFSVRLFTSIRACSGNRVPALSTRRPSTRTSPARIIASAFCGESASARSTRRASRRFLLGLAVMLRTSSAADYQELGHLTQAAGAFAVRSKFGDGVVRELMRNFVGALQAVNRGVGGFLLRDIFAGRFAQRRGRFLDVQNVVGNLKCPANRFTKPPQARYVFRASTRAEGTGGDGTANQRGRL